MDVQISENIKGKSQRKVMTSFPRTPIITASISSNDAIVNLDLDQIKAMSLRALVCNKPKKIKKIKKEKLDRDDIMDLICTATKSGKTSISFPQKQGDFDELMFYQEQGYKITEKPCKSILGKLLPKQLRISWR